LVTAVVGGIVVSAAGTHTALMLILVPMLVTVALLSPKSLLVLLVVWMTLLGLLRRLIPGGHSAVFSGDPMLIVGPACIFFLFVVAMNRGAFHRRSALATTVLCFNVVCVLEAFNPAQGGTTVGLGGLLFVLVPMLMFWVGRVLLDDVDARRIIWVVAVLSVASAAYGLYQEFNHFPSWDARWIASSGYTALNVGNGVVRAFGASSSAQEYATFLGLGVVAWLSLRRGASRFRGLLALCAAGFLAYAIYYEAQRTLLFLGVLAVGVMFAARLRLRPFGVFLVAVLAIVGVVTFAHQLGGSSSCPPNDAACTLANRANTAGDPLGQQSSLSGHISETRQGIKAGYQHPLGRGTGSTTLAASRFNSSSRASRGTEFDPGNAGTAFGIFGLVLYPMTLILGLRAGYRVAVRRNDTIGLFALGAMTVDLLQWLNGDLYSVTWLVWLFIGWADLQNQAIDLAETAPSPVLEPLAPGRRRWTS